MNKFFDNLTVRLLDKDKKKEYENILQEGNKAVCKYTKKPFELYTAFSLGVEEIEITPEDRAAIKNVLAIEGIMLESYLGVIMNILRKFPASDYMSEIFQDEALEAFRNALFTYKGTTQFSTYLSNVIKNKLRDVIMAKPYRNQDAQLSKEGEIESPNSINDLVEQGWMDVDRELMYKAIEVAPFTSLERAVFVEYIEDGKHGFMTAALRKCPKNPNTGKPYSRMAATNALKSSKKVYRRTYLQLTNGNTFSKAA